MRRWLRYNELARLDYKERERLTRQRKNAYIGNRNFFSRHLYHAECEYCGNMFWTNYSIRIARYLAGDKSARAMRFCSVDCRLAYYKAERKRKRAESRGLSHCLNCGKEFIAKRNDARYCSNKCRQQAYRNRKKTIHEKISSERLNVTKER